MSFSLKIEINDNSQESLVHKFRNFGEDVYLELRNSCDISIEEIDKSTTNFFIHNIKGKNIGEVTQKVKSLLIQHNLLEAVTLLRTKSEQDH